MNLRDSSTCRVRCVAVLLLTMVLILPACSKEKYYRITDLSDGTVFYTKDFDPANARDIGRAKFVDANSAALIRLDVYEAKQISKKAFNRVLPKD